MPINFSTPPTCFTQVQGMHFVLTFSQWQESQLEIWKGDGAREHWAVLEDNFSSNHKGVEF